MGDWRIEYDGKQYSGESADEVLAWLADGRIPEHAQVYHVSLGDWVKVTELESRLSPPPPPPKVEEKSATPEPRQVDLEIEILAEEERAKRARERSESGKWKKAALIGLMVIVAGVIAIYPIGQSAIGFVLIWIGAALILKKQKLSVALLGSFLIAIVLFYPFNEMQTVRNEGKRIEAEAAAEKALAVALMTEIGDKMAAGDWEGAGDLFKRLERIRESDIDAGVLSGLWDQIEPNWNRVRAEKVEAGRRASVQSGLEKAEAVVSDKKLCDTPTAVAEAWTMIRKVNRSDPEWSRAVAVSRRLERCRNLMEQHFGTGVRKVMQQQRVDFGNRLRKASLDSGMDIKVSVTGNNKDRLTLRFALMGDVMVHQLTDGGSMKGGSFLSNSQKAGFRRVTFEDGFDYGYYYTLEPPDESQSGKTAMKEFGLSDPIVLK